MVPDISFPSVDVRDVARAHVMVMVNEALAGRYLLSEGTYSFKDLCVITKAQGFSQVCISIIENNLMPIIQSNLLG